MPTPRRKSGEVPAIPTDKARLHVAMWKLANGLGVTLDASRTDHELLEQIADALSPKLARAFREGVCWGREDNQNPGALAAVHCNVNPYDGTEV